MNAGDKVRCLNGSFPKGIERLYRELPVAGHIYLVRDVRIGVDLTGDGDTSGNITISTGVGATSSGSVHLTPAGGAIPGDILLTVSGGNIVLAGVPTVAPATTGAVWADPVTHILQIVP